MELLPQEQKSSWQKVKDIAQVAALSTLMSLFMPGTAAAEHAHDTHDTQGSIEQLQSHIAQKEKALESFIREKGTVVYLNGHEAREMKSSTGDVVIVGETQAGKTWISLHTPDNTLTYLDWDASGSVDRIVMNHEKSEHDIVERSKPVEDLMDAFADINSHETEAELAPVHKTIIAFAEHDGRHLVRTVSLETGEKQDLEGKDAMHVTEKVNQGFLNGLETFGQ